MSKLVDLFDEIDKKSELHEEISPEVKNIPKKPGLQKRLGKVQKYTPKQPKTVKEYQPHGTDIMTSYRLISGKSIREYKGKGTKKALLEGLIRACLDLKSKLKK